MNFDDMDEQEPDIECTRYGPVELPEVTVAKFCLEMWRWSRSHAQWSQHYESVTGLWEWYFW